MVLSTGNAALRLRVAATLLGLLTTFASLAGAPVADEKVVEFGERLAAAMNKKDGDAIGNLIDVHSLALRVGRDMGVPDAELNGFTRGFEETGKKSLVDRLVSNLRRAEVEVKMMKVVHRGGDQRAVLRIDLGSEGFDYAEFIVEADDKGVCRTTDWYQLSLGQLFSSAAGAASRLMIDPNPSLLQRVFGSVAIDRTMVEKIKAITLLEKQSKYREALAAMQKLPPEIANSRIFSFRQVQLAGLTKDDALYRQSLDSLAQHFADDPAAAFILIDHYFYKQQMDKVMKSIDFIQRRVGVDGLTETLRATIHYSANDYEAMLAAAEHAVQVEPSRSGSYFVLALAQVSTAHYDKAVQTYKKMGAEFGYTFSVKKSAENPDMKQFMESAAFKKWLPN